MARSVRPFLMFVGAAEEALGFYASLFDDGAVTELVRWGPGEAGPEGKVMKATLSIAGQTVMAFDSPPVHAFTFTPSTSLFVECADEAEIDRLNAALGEGGAALMALGSYGFSRKFAWVNDRFGVSWQLNLA